MAKLDYEKSTRMRNALAGLSIQEEEGETVRKRLKGPPPLSKHTKRKAMEMSHRSPTGIP